MRERKVFMLIITTLLLTACQSGSIGSVLKTSNILKSEVIKKEDIEKEGDVINSEEEQNEDGVVQDTQGNEITNKNEESKQNNGTGNQNSNDNNQGNKNNNGNGNNSNGSSPAPSRPDPTPSPSPNPEPNKPNPTPTPPPVDPKPNYNIGNSNKLFDTEQQAIDYGAGMMRDYDDGVKYVSGYVLWQTYDKFTVNLTYSYWK